MKQILIVEDDRALADGIALALHNNALHTTLCHDLASAVALLTEESFDLLILDINLPDGNGLHYLRELRQTNRLPVIILTANDLESDIVTGLELGADDYMTKPFSLAILRARVNAQLRRTVSPSHYELGELRFDFDRMEFRKGELLLELSKTEQKLLRLLVSNPGITLSRGDLVDRIWTDGAEYVDENALSVTVKRLRDKLGNTSHIKTVYGLGYSWVVN